ncbi:MAG: hypothetical protein AAFP82_21750, partial [Bacteroidota bacterium]
IFTSYMMDEVLKHDLAIFYISSSKIEESDRKIAEEYNSDHRKKTNCNATIIEDIIQHYFDNAYFEEQEYDFTPNYDWSTLEGIFLIPTLFSDQRVVYYCIPNARRKKDILREIKDYPDNSLENWLNMVDKELSENEELVISGNDENFIYIEEWSVFFCKNASLEIKKKKELYLEHLLRNELS